MKVIIKSKDKTLYKLSKEDIKDLIIPLGEYIERCRNLTEVMYRFEMLDVGDWLICGKSYYKINAS